MIYKYNMFDIDNFQEQINNKLDNDMGNLNANIDYLVDAYDNGTQWYRLYKNGWCEQGGVWTTANASYNAYYVSLLIPYKTNTYTAIAMPGYTSNNLYTPQVGSRTTTGIQFYYVYNSTGFANWYACGPTK